MGIESSGDESGRIEPGKEGSGSGERGSGSGEQTPVDEIVETASGWPEVTAGPHRFDAVEFSLGDHEVGHVHRSGTLDVNFPRRIRDALVEEGRTGEHHVVPNSGWTTFRVHDRSDVEDGLWLLRVADRYRALTLRRKPTGQAVLDAEDVAAALDDLGTSDRVRGVFEDMIGVDS